jgi:hypothetical protein
MTHNDNEAYDMTSSKHIWLSAFMLSLCIEIFLKTNRQVELIVFDKYSDPVAIVWAKVNEKY